MWNWPSGDPPFRAPPTDSEQPRLRLREQPHPVAGCGREGIIGCLTPVVVRRVPEHVRDRVHQLGGRQQQARVEVVLELAAARLHQAVQRLRDADVEPLHAA